MDRGHEPFTKCSGKFWATFIEIFHASFLLLRYLKYYTKSCRNLSWKVLELFRSRLQTFQPIFAQPCRNISRNIIWNCCVKIHTVITRNISETFLKYFVTLLQGGHEYFAKYFLNFSETFIDIFHASSLITPNLAECFRQSFLKSS